MPIPPFELKHHQWYWIYFKEKVVPALYHNNADGSRFTENHTFEVTSDFYNSGHFSGMFIPEKMVTVLRPLEPAPPTPFKAGWYWIRKNLPYYPNTKWYICYLPTQPGQRYELGEPAFVTNVLEKYRP